MLKNLIKTLKYPSKKDMLIGVVVVPNQNNF